MSNSIPKYLIVITPTISNLFVSINSTKGHLYRTFSFTHVRITAAVHRKRKLFAQEFGAYFGRYITNLNIKAQFEVKIKGADGRAFSFLEHFILKGGSFSKLEFYPLNPFNGCRTAKRKRI